MLSSCWTVSKIVTGNGLLVDSYSNGYLIISEFLLGSANAVWKKGTNEFEVEGVMYMFKVYLAEGGLVRDMRLVMGKEECYCQREGNKVIWQCESWRQGGKAG